MLVFLIKRISSPFLKIHNVFIDPFKIKKKFPFFTSIFVVMDFGFMDLRKYLNERKVITFEEARLICKNILHAFFYFNSLGFLHRDLKPDNFLIDPQNLEVKIIDFGHSGFEDTSKCFIFLCNVYKKSNFKYFNIFCMLI